jgi:uncharacterized membrane protein YdjX (TVP38/TMEM64 family)
LFYYIFFLRVTPILPNWFINIASPVVDVPILPFFLGTFAGVAPPSVFFIQAGKTIHQMTSTNVISWTSMLFLFLLGLLSLAPILYNRKYKPKSD